MIGIIIGIIFLIIAYFLFNWYFVKSKRALVKAVAVINTDKIKGIIYFNELFDGNTRIYGKIIGLTNTKYNLTIYEKGNMINGCASLGNHYNPNNKNHGNRIIEESNGGVKINYDRHVGDLGFIYPNKKGEVNINFVDPLIKLNGETSVLGRGIAISINDTNVACSIISLL